MALQSGKFATRRIAMAAPKADYHILYLGPGLNADWLFKYGRVYILHFEPALTATLDTLQFIPPRRVVAITSIARRDTAQRIAQEVARRFPRAYHDALVYDFPEELQMTLEGRVSLEQRLGVPETET
jgi:hypothetical protein